MWKDMEDFRNDCIEKGRVEQAKDMAVELANMGVSVEQIAKAAKQDTKTVKSWLDKKKALNC